MSYTIRILPLICCEYYRSVECRGPLLIPPRRVSKSKISSTNPLELTSIQVRSAYPFQHCYPLLGRRPLRELRAFLTSEHRNTPPVVLLLTFSRELVKASLLPKPMIIDKQPLPGDEVDFQDAPPSYDALDNVPPPLPRDEKAGPSILYPPAAPHLPSPAAPKSPITPSTRSAGKRPSSSWFNFGPAARASKEVRTTIQGLIRDLVKQNDPQGALGVLESCADACRSFDLAISTLLQERTIEGHTPLYWAIINRPSESATESVESDEPDLVTALLSHAAPLSDATVDELRLACLHTSDHGLFQRLRRTPAFSPLSGADELILGGNVPVDDVDVEDVPGDESGFIARFRMPMFQKRMRISEEISLEFIAKGAQIPTSPSPRTHKYVRALCRAAVGAQVHRRKGPRDARRLPIHAPRKLGRRALSPPTQPSNVDRLATRHRGPPRADTSTSAPGPHGASHVSARGGGGHDAVRRAARLCETEAEDRAAHEAFGTADCAPQHALPEPLRYPCAVRGEHARAQSAVQVRSSCACIECVSLTSIAGAVRTSRATDRL